MIGVLRAKDDCLQGFSAFSVRFVVAEVAHCCRGGSLLPRLTSTAETAVPDSRFDGEQQLR
ncbi:hypothetical protein G7067_02915 [Leucobacter insecticola]|uniref:Uncharacterized protein n=1 Tax=Leucobacter insecticola TaxID=2714934 RepID=A0A6G8FHT7_9MICO|nr:hypothetical protein [Leucobacter insecticola]QIM15602.1 hypothetical protein G7067_02915 [Leucobacter insecticola]